MKEMSHIKAQDKITFTWEDEGGGKMNTWQGTNIALLVFTRINPLNAT